VEYTAFIEDLLEQVSQRSKAVLREALHSAYSHGRTDALAPILAAAGIVQDAPLPEAKPVRVAQNQAIPSEVKVPRGLPEKFVARAMSAIDAPGISPTDIIPKFARTPQERAISYSALRKALRRGREDGNYKNKGGKWFRA
jgi:hypothetical protein